MSDEVKLTKQAEKALASVYHAITLEDLENSFAKLEPNVQVVLRQEAKSLKKMMLWGWLHETMQAKACKKIYIDSTTVEQLIFGKAALWNEEVRERMVKNLMQMPDEGTKK